MCFQQILYMDLINIIFNNNLYNNQIVSGPIGFPSEELALYLNTFGVSPCLLLLSDII